MSAISRRNRTVFSPSRRIPCGFASDTLTLARAMLNGTDILIEAAEWEVDQYEREQLTHS